MDDKSDYLPRRPPAYGYPDDDDAAPRRRPDFVLLEEYAYFADRDNATTASCDMRGLGGSIKVTFCTAHPPRVSYLCVHTTAFDHTAFPIEPHVLATEGGLVLLCVILGRRPSDMFKPRMSEYFVYDAGTKGKEGRRPSLKHLPHPGHYRFDGSTVALVRHCSNHRHGASNHDRSNRRHGASGFTLRPNGASQEDHDCGDCNYVIATKRCGIGKSIPHELCVYHSETETWSTKLVTAPENGPYQHDHSTSKAITIGGEHGTVGWVNLWQDILFFDVLANRPKLRCVNLPPPITASKRLGHGDPSTVRNVAVVDGFIEYTELETRYVPGSYMDDGSITFDGWKAAKWSMKITESLGETWHRDYELDSSEISESSLPKLQVDADTAAAQPTLQTLHIGMPNLSLQDDGIVYFLTKIDYRDSKHTAWVLAVDMRNKTIQGVAEFGAERTVSFTQAYIASRISKYLKVPGTNQEQKRQGMRLMGSSSKKQHGMS